MNFGYDVDIAKNLIVENAQYMKSFENDGNKLCEELKRFNDEIFNMRLDLGENLIRLKTKHKRLEQILKNVADESYTLEDVSMKFEEAKQAEEKKVNRVQQSAEYKEFKNRMYKIMKAPNADGIDNDDGNDDEYDDDLIMDVEKSGDNACSMYDPWSKALMKHPVRNIKCGHHYDLDSVMSVIKDNMSVRCPVVGCASKNFIQPNHLEDDIQLLQKIEAYIAEQDAENALSSEEDDD